MQAISSFKLLNVRPFLCRGGTCKGDMKMALKFLDGRRDEPSYVRANDVSIPPFFPRKKMLFLQLFQPRAFICQTLIWP